MNESKIIEVLNILQNDNIDYSEKRRKMKAYFKTNDFRYLIDDYEKDMYGIDKDKIPHFTFIFYTSLVFMFLDNIDAIADYIKKRPSSKFLIIGISIFLQSKSNNLKYQCRLNDKLFENKLEYISRFNGKFIEFGNIMRYVFYLLQIIYKIDKDKAIDLILKDRQNIFFVSFFTEMSVKLQKDDIIRLLNLDDELKVNAVLYYITRNFKYGVSKYKYSQSEENIKYLNDEAKELYKIFTALDNERAVYLIVNYIFTEDVFPKFFIDLLKAADKNIIIENLQRQDLKNLLKLINIDFFIKKLRYKEIENLFIDNLILFFKEDFNESIWRRVSSIILDIISNLSKESKVNLRRGLKQVKEKLCLSKFDKQVRYIRYHDDITRKDIIEEVENHIIK